MAMTRLNSRPAMMRLCPINVHYRNIFSFTADNTTRKRFSPESILPHEFGHVRILNNTTRDAQQSNVSAEMADEHRQVLFSYSVASLSLKVMTTTGIPYRTLFAGHHQTD